MNPRRRLWLKRLAWLQLAASGTGFAQTAADAADPVRRGRPMAFPRDHGAHLGVRTEWWYATGWLGAAAADNSPLLGFQLTFFRSSTGLAQQMAGRFAPRQLLFAHAALTDLAGQRHLHDQRIQRWNGAPDAALGHAALVDGDVQIGNWSLRRSASDLWQARLPARDFSLDLSLASSQAPLLQGDAGFSRKGPQERQASHYYSQPQLAASGSVGIDLGKPGRAGALTGRAWLDHEWSDEILHPEAVGWDWIGMNLFDGSALTAFVLRRKDGTALWAGGSWRAADGSVRSFEPGQLRWQPGRVWRSPGSAASYPVEWRLTTPVGSFGVRALLDAQELDSRGSTGSIYWEGLSELLDADGGRIGLGYLEMTGYAGPLKMA